MGRRRQEVEQCGNKIGYWSEKGDNILYGVYSSHKFWHLHSKFIEVPEESPDYKGFLVEVTQDLKKETVKG